MSGIKWTDPSDKAHKSWAEIAGLALSAAPTGHWMITPKHGGVVLASGHHPACSLTAAKYDAETFAEPLLRAAYAELVACFAPVLRWDIDEHSTARLGPWMLEASTLGWSIYLDSPLTGRELIADECTDRVERALNRRAAENALRGFGVPFRTEDE